MLLELRVRNLALIEDARVRFAPGLNVLTGETGAGKSLVLSALVLLLGGRWSREMLRTGAPHASVRGVFEISTDDLARAVFAVIDEDAPDAPVEIVVTRRVDASGRNRCEVAGSLVPVATLRSLSELIAEVHVQGEHRALLDPLRQTSLLDRAAGLRPQRTLFAEALHAWRDVRARLDVLRRGGDARDRRLDELRAVVAEVAAVSLEPGELDALRRERELLAAAERHAETIGTAQAGLLHGDAQGASAEDRVGAALRAIEEAAELSDQVGAAAEALERAADALAEAGRHLDDALSRIEADPERLEIVQDRIEAIGAMLRRHGPTEEAALTRAADAAEEAESLAGDDRDASELTAAVADAASTALAVGRALDDARVIAGRAFAADVRAALAELDMTRTRFEVALPSRGDTPLDAASEIGLGPIEFVASPNPGEDLKPLARIASGGELARTALAIRGRLAGADGLSILAFDEVDADVGPRLGDVIGRRLAALATERQVLAVTHLPQVAAHGAHHLRVRKTVDGGRTHVAVDALTGDERAHEIAEMIRGAARAHEALDQARAMLAEAASR